MRRFDEVIEARGFYLIDGDGTRLGAFHNHRGSPHLSLFDKQERVRLECLLDETGHPAVALADSAGRVWVAWVEQGDGGGVFVLDSEQNIRGLLGANTSGEVLLDLRDAYGHGWIQLIVNRLGEPTVRVRTAAGRAPKRRPLLVEG